MFRNRVTSSSVSLVALLVVSLGVAPALVPTSPISAVAPEPTTSTTVVQVAEQPTTTVVEPTTTVAPVPEPAPTTTAAPAPAPVVKPKPAPKVATTVTTNPGAIDGPQPLPTEPQDPNPTRDGKSCIPEGCDGPDAGRWYHTLEGYCSMTLPQNFPWYATEAPECETDKTQRPIPYKVITDEYGSTIEYPNGNPWGPPPAGKVVLL